MDHKDQLKARKLGGCNQPPLGWPRMEYKAVSSSFSLSSLLFSFLVGTYYLLSRSRWDFLLFHSNKPLGIQAS